MGAPYNPPPRNRPIGVAILAILIVLVGAIFLLAAILVFLVAGVAAIRGLPTFFGLAGAVLGALFLIFALLFIAVGLGLWHLRSWAWWLAVIVLVLSIVGSLADLAGLVIPLILLIYLVLVRHHFR
jgi:hypothetical protein